MKRIKSDIIFTLKNPQATIFQKRILHAMFLENKCRSGVAVPRAPVQGPTPEVFETPRSHHETVLQNYGIFFQPGIYFTSGKGNVTMGNEQNSLATSDLEASTALLVYLLKL